MIFNVSSKLTILFSPKGQPPGDCPYKAYGIFGRRGESLCSPLYIISHVELTYIYNTASPKNQDRKRTGGEKVIFFSKNLIFFKNLSTNFVFLYPLYV